MGIHFDSLVDTLSKIDSSEKYLDSTGKRLSLRDTLTDIVQRTALFNFSLNAEEIRPAIGMTDEEYKKYMKDYFETSNEHGTSLIRPFPTTGIEDKDSAVICDPINEYEFRILVGNKEMVYGEITERILFASIKGLGWNEDSDQFGSKVGYLSHLYVVDNKRVILPRTDEVVSSVLQDSFTAALSYAEQVMYIMDPENFIIREESNASKKQTAKDQRRGKVVKQRKTELRPHYVCLSADDTKELFKDGKDKRAAHPVRGHWRRFMSDRFTHMKGKRKFIPQYFTGNGKVSVPGGINYEVMVKEGPQSVVPYSESRI